MMSTAQINLHWGMKIGWGRVCQANDWFMDKGRLSPDAQHNRELSEYHRKVWNLAQLIAHQDHREIKPDDFRKAAYIVALGKPKSFTAFDNDDLDRVLIIFRLLINPDDLDAMNQQMAYEAYDAAMAEQARCKQLRIPCTVQIPDHPGERRRHIAGIKLKAPEQYILKVSLGKFGTRYWVDLSLEELRQLTRTLSQRKPAWGRPSRFTRPTQQERESVFDEANAPF